MGALSLRRNHRNRRPHGAIRWSRRSKRKKSECSAGGRTLDVVGVGRLDPAHQAAQLATGLLDRVGSALGPQRVELRGARVLVGDEALSESAALDVREHGLHVLFYPLVDDARTR